MKTNQSSFYIPASLVFAATVGAGVFSLPYAFAVAGWGTGLLLLLVLSTVVVAAHVWYLRVLEAVPADQGLLGLVRAYLGTPFFYVGSLSLVGGLLLAACAHIILATAFLAVLMPSMPPAAAAFFFWVCASVPLLLRLKRVVKLEVWAVLIMMLCVVLAFAASAVNGFVNISFFSGHDTFFPFGPILFSLAGWTAIEPIAAWMRRSGTTVSRAVRGVAAGTFVASLLYLVLIAGVAGAPGAISQDTISGLANWAPWKQVLVSIFGLFAVWASYLPASLEVENALRRDLGRSARFSTAFVLLMPLLLVFAGADVFIIVVGVAGGILLSMEYGLILLLAKKVLHLRGKALYAWWAVFGVFCIAAVTTFWRLVF